MNRTNFRGSSIRGALCAMAQLFLAATGAGQAAVYYSGVCDAIIPANDTGIYVNPLTRAVTTTMPVDFESAPWLNFFFGGTAIGSSPLIHPAIVLPPTGSGDGLVLRLPHLQEIGPGLNFAEGANGSENHTGGEPWQFESGTPGYLGFSFGSAEGEPFYFGWMEITIDEMGTGIVHDWSYAAIAEEAIQAGVVPEPGVPLLSLMAALPLVVKRRRGSTSALS